MFTLGVLFFAITYLMSCAPTAIVQNGSPDQYSVIESAAMFVTPIGGSSGGYMSLDGAIIRGGGKYKGGKLTILPGDHVLEVQYLSSTRGGIAPQTERFYFYSEPSKRYAISVFITGGSGVLQIVEK